MTELGALNATVELTRENERLHAELHAQAAELDCYRRRLAGAIEAERKRIERDLHDATQQRLVSVAMALGLLEAKLPADPDAAKPIARHARRVLAGALEELRELTHGIHPAILTERGLQAALEELVERAALPIRLELSIGIPPPVAVGTAAYFIVSEALTNAVKHAGAMDVRITVARKRDLLTVEVADNGIGGAGSHRGSGLRGLTDRVEALGGRLTVTSPPHGGTTVRAQLPCGAEVRLAPACTLPASRRG